MQRDLEDNKSKSTDKTFENTIDEQTFFLLQIKKGVSTLIYCKGNLRIAAIFLYNCHATFLVGDYMEAYLIIEKENSTIKVINDVLKYFLDLTCVGVTDDYESSMNILLKKSPDLVFLILMK